MEISNIILSLSHGIYNSGKRLRFLYLCMIIMLLLPLFTVIMIFLPIEWDHKIIATLVIGNIMMLSFFFVFVFIIFKNKKLKDKIDLWIEDAVETKAYSKKLDEYLSGIASAMKIQVKFKIADKTFIKESTVKTFGGKKGYLGNFKQYADREISILYSQKYDEVLILKDKKIQHKQIDL